MDRRHMGMGSGTASSSDGGEIVYFGEPDATPRPATDTPTPKAPAVDLNSSGWLGDQDARTTVPVMDS